MMIPQPGEYHFPFSPGSPVQPTHPAHPHLKVALLVLHRLRGGYRGRQSARRVGAHPNPAAWLQLKKCVQRLRRGGEGQAVGPPPGWVTWGAGAQRQWLGQQ